MRSFRALHPGVFEIGGQAVSRWDGGHHERAFVSIFTATYRSTNFHRAVTVPTCRAFFPIIMINTFFIDDQGRLSGRYNGQ